MRIFLNGFMGSGKSSLGKKVASKIKAPFIDLDEEIETSSGKSISRIFEEEGEGKFRKMERNTLLKIIQNKTHFVLACGGGTACFYDNVGLMNQKGFSVFLDVEEGILLGRLREKRAQRPLISSLNEDELKNFIHAKLMERKPFYEQSTIILKTNNPTATLLLKAMELFQKN